MPDEMRGLDPADPPIDHLVHGIWEESTRLETVLVVHGYPSLREALVRTLEHYGYRAVEASTREQAIRVARRERIDLVLLDFDLGTADGPALAGEIASRAETRDVPVIALSSDTMAGGGPLLPPFQEVLAMPVEQKDLLAALDRSLEAARRRSRAGLLLEARDEQCRLPLEDRLRSEHLSLFFRYPVRTRIELLPANEGRIHDLSGQLAELAIHPEIRMEAGDLVLLYELSIADAFALGTRNPIEELFLSLVEAFPELGTRPDALRRRLTLLESEYRRLQRIAS